jgi:hypothetical protein
MVPGPHPERPSGLRSGARRLCLAGTSVLGWRMRTVGLWTWAVGVLVIVISYASNVAVTTGLVVVAVGMAMTAVGRRGRSTGRLRSPSGPMQATTHDVDAQTGTITSDRGWDGPRR